MARSCLTNGWCVRWMNDSCLNSNWLFYLNWVVLLISTSTFLQFEGVTRRKKNPVNQFVQNWNSNLRNWNFDPSNCKHVSWIENTTKCENDLWPKIEADGDSKINQFVQTWKF